MVNDFSLMEEIKTKWLQTKNLRYKPNLWVKKIAMVTPNQLILSFLSDGVWFSADSLTCSEMCGDKRVCIYIYLFIYDYNIYIDWIEVWRNVNPKNSGEVSPSDVSSGRPW